MMTLEQEDLNNLNSYLAHVSALAPVKYVFVSYTVFKRLQKQFENLYGVAGNALEPYQFLFKDTIVCWSLAISDSQIEPVFDLSKKPLNF